MADWHGHGSQFRLTPVDGIEISVTKWSKCWHWAIDTVPSAILNMETDPKTGCNKIISMPGGSYIAQGRAGTSVKAKAAALEAWKCR